MRGAVPVLASGLVVLVCAGCGGSAPSAAPANVHALVRELDQTPLDHIVVFADQGLTTEAFRLAPTELVEILEAGRGRNPDSGAEEPIYKIRHQDREGWIPGYLLKR